MGKWKDRMMKGRMSKNIQDLRDPKKAARHNSKVYMDNEMPKNENLLSKKPISEQEDIETDVVNYVNNNVKGVRDYINKSLTWKDYSGYDSQVTPGKFQYKTNLGPRRTSKRKK